MAIISLSTESTFADNVAAGGSALVRSSGEVFCEQRRCLATVSVVRREADRGVVCYVQWCSLRGIENGCPENCILRSPVASSDPSCQPAPLR